MSYKKCMERLSKFPRLARSSETLSSEDALNNTKGVRKKILPENSFEVLEVEHLNPFFISLSNGSTLAEKITSKRRARNEILMQKLADDLNELNMKIEENIRISTGEVKAHMADYKEELYQMLDSLDVPEVESYHETVFKSIQESAYEMKLSQIRLIKDLHRTLCKLERLRSKENEKIFHVIFQQIEKTAYLSPYEIQSFVEQEALKMNQLMLNNRRCYEDLRLKLSLIIEHTYKSFMDEVFCIREKWIRLNKIQVDEETTESTESIMIKAEVRLELQGHELQFHLSEDKCYSLVDTGDWLNNINDVKKCIDQHESKLIDTFKKLQQVIRKGLSCEFDDVRRRLNQIDDIQFQERPLQPLLFSICPEGEDMFYEFEKCWQRTLKEIKAELKYARDVILDFGNLWTRHSNRVSESKLLILKAVEKTDENDLTILQDLEVKVNLSIDLLRQEYNKDKIEPLYNAVVANLDTIKDKLESGYLNVVSIVEEYYKMMELEADVLSPEIKEFLYIKHAESSTLIRKDEGCMEKTEYYNATQKGFLKLIENLLSGLNSMKLWNSGMRSALERTSNNAREILKSRAEVWVASRIQGLARRYQCLLEMHSKRYGRIRSQIYEVRLQEIYTHEKVYEQHKLGMEHMYKKLTKSAEDLNENCLRNVDEYHFKIATTMDKALLEERAAIVKNYQTQINREKIVFNNEIETQWEFLRGEIETTACMIQQSNTKFMKSIKLFHENGNYDAEEAKMYIQYLDGIEKQNFNEEKNISKEVNKKESELRQKVSDISEEANRLFSQLYEELRFDADVRNVFNLCITAMKDGATEMKMDFESLVKYCNYAKVLVEDLNICLTQEHDASWFTFIDSLYKNINNLLFAIEPPQWIGDKIDESIYGESMGSLPNKIIQDPMEQRKDPTLKPKLTPTDIISGLFESSLFFDDAGKFQKIIFGGCVNHMDCIQKLGSTFYKSNKNLIRTDLLKISYDEFWKDIFQKFRNLALQLELDWVQITARFLHILSESKMIFKAYFKKRIKQLTDGVLEAFGCLETEFLNTFNSEVCTLLDELHKLKTKLLTLHGHSRNRKLLNDLEDEVVRKTAELDLNWEKFIKNQMDQLECLDSKNIMEVSEWQTLKCLFLKCLDVLFADELGQGVANTLQLIIEKGGYVCKPKTEEICATEGKPTFYRVYDYSKIDFVTKLKLNLDDVIGMEQEIETFFCEITQKINPENGPTFSEEDGNTKNSDFNTSGLFIPVIQPKFNFLDITDSDMKRLDDRYVQIRNLIKSKAHFQNDLIYGWLDKWKANVEKIVQLHSVKYCQSENGSSDSIGVKVTKIPMAELKTLKPKTKNVGASSTSLLSKFSQKRLSNQDTLQSTISRKSQSAVNRSYSNEVNKGLGNKFGNEKKNTQNNIKPIQTDKKPELNKSERTMSITSLGSLSPSKHHSHIPIPSKYQKYTWKSEQIKRKVSVAGGVSPRTGANSEKTIFAYPKKKSKANTLLPDNLSSALIKVEKAKTDRSVFPATRSFSQRPEKSDCRYFRSAMSPKKRSLENNLSITNSYTTITLSSPRAEGDLPALESPTQISQANSSTYTYEDIFTGEGKNFLSTSISKSSLGCDFDVDSCIDAQCPQRPYYKLYGSSAVREIEASVELLNLSNNGSESQEFSTAAGSFVSTPEGIESKRTGLHRAPQTTIRTLSGDELVLSSSMEFDLESENILQGENDETIDRLLRDVENGSLAKEFHSVLDDDAKELDMETHAVTDPLQSKYAKSETDFPSCSQSKNNNSECGVKEEGSVSWTNQENELLTDVSYRQFVYHPTVLRRQSTEERQEDKTRPRSKSNEDKSNFSLDESEKTGRSRKKCFRKKHVPQSYVSNRDVNINPLRPWSEKAPQNEDREMYDHLQMMQNSDYVLQEIKRERSKGERITGALLRITAKFIHLLAILNLWPGDSCQLLTSHSILYRR